VKENLRLLRVQPDGLLVGDEMHFVAARRKLNPKLGPDHATAAVCGITGDSYFHYYFCRLLLNVVIPNPVKRARVFTSARVGVRDLVFPENFNCTTNKCYRSAISGCSSAHGAGSDSPARELMTQNCRLCLIQAKDKGFIYTVDCQNRRNCQTLPKLGLETHHEFWALSFSLWILWHFWHFWQFS
jgi:hypothetical protein